MRHDKTPDSLDTPARDNAAHLALDKAAISGSEVQGQLQVDRSSMPPRISGNLYSAALDINRFPVTSAETLEGAGQEIDKDSGDLIDERPIDRTWLEAAALDLDIRLDELTFNQTRFRNVRTKLALQDGQLRIDPFDADLSKGGVRGDMRIRKTDAGAAVDTRLVVTELMPADLGQPDEGLIDGGETDLVFELRANGASPQQLAGTLNGEIALEIQRATVRNNLFEMIGSDILMQTVSLINPFMQKDDRTDLECAAVRFEAADGVLSSPDQIVIETSKMKIRGGGDIDLGKETLRIDFVPSARKGLGISAGDLAKFVRLGGTLGNPHPVADPRGILKSGATIGAAIATGGVSLLAQDLFKRARNTGTACGRIFENSTEVPDAIRSPDPATGAGS